MIKQSIKSFLTYTTLDYFDMLFVRLWYHVKILQLDISNLKKIYPAGYW